VDGVKFSALQDSADKGRLPRLLKAVAHHADQSRAEGDGWVPGPIDNSIEAMDRKGQIVVETQLDDSNSVGGGLYSTGNGSTTLIDSRIVANAAYSGAGI